MRRVALWAGLGLLLAVAVVVVLLPRLLGSDLSRERLEAILGEALGRTVTIEAIVVERGAPVVELRGVTVAQPPSLAEAEPGPMLHAERMRLEVGLDDLLAHRVAGLAQAEGVTLTVLERGGQTSVHGLGRSGKGARPAREPGTRPELALDLELSRVSLRLVDLDRGEAIEVQEVALRGHLDDRPGSTAEREAIATLTAAAVHVHGIAIHDVLVQTRLADAAIELVRLHARLGERGTLEGHGTLGLPAKGAESSEDWGVELALDEVALDGPLRDLAATALPAVVRATGTPGEPTTGRLAATLSLRGRGLRWSTIEPSLVGTASLELHDVVVPADALVLGVAGFAGRAPGPWAVKLAWAELAVAEGWITPGPIDLGELHPRLQGRVSLQGELDLSVDLMPFVELYGGGVHAAVARTTTTLPVRVTGTIRQPHLAPPRAKDVASGLVGGVIRRALEAP